MLNFLQTQNMSKSALFDMPAPLIAIVIFVLIFIANGTGFRYRKSRLRRNKENEDEGEGLGTVESSMLGLMALIMGFTFSMAASKFEARRQIVVEEANNIGTALLRCDMYPDSVRNLLRAHFKDYLDTRIAYYEARDDDDKIRTTLDQTADHFKRIWQIASSFTHDPRFLISSAQMIPALNNMTDIVSTREASRVAKVPPIILILLLVLTLGSSFLLGYGTKTKQRNDVMIFGFTLLTTMVLYLIIELDRPRRGILTLDAAEKMIVDLRKGL
ncbi:hypothetical protein FPE01S_03_05880 [Flavihumibacter petaseus NBRC 106054]|uniref:DUF4239 domain-containing protein n=2 Tax=Flavihumibacter TaxID=1004301 RepID=A0A0E9N5D3_9BACT|nr:hypothetical protein FPE01S_03_05880 [Flavihumibacter petaseus NBRC 106054]